jgi:hypothetical protein
MGLYDDVAATAPELAGRERLTIHADRAGAPEPMRDKGAVGQALDLLSSEVGRNDRLVLELAERVRAAMPELLPDGEAKTWQHFGVPLADTISSAAMNVSNTNDRLDVLLRYLAL